MLLFFASIITRSTGPHDSSLVTDSDKSTQVLHHLFKTVFTEPEIFRCLTFSLLEVGAKFSSIIQQKDTSVLVRYKELMTLVERPKIYYEQSITSLHPLLQPVPFRRQNIMRMIIAIGAGAWNVGRLAELEGKSQTDCHYIKDSFFKTQIAALYHFDCEVFGEEKDPNFNPFKWITNLKFNSNEGILWFNLTKKAYFINPIAAEYLLSNLSEYSAFDINEKNKEGYNALMYHIGYSKGVQLIEVFVNSGIDIDAVNPINGHTALHVAVLTLNFGAVKKLLNLGASTVICNAKGQMFNDIVKQSLNFNDPSSNSIRNHVAVLQELINLERFKDGVEYAV